MTVTQDKIASYLSIITEGLKPEPVRSQRVIIVGAGVAGLVAAYELLRAGHDPVLLEARQRVGGRVYTLREPFAQGLYAEAGAMRIPRSHVLTMAYVKKWGLSVSPFTMHNPRGFCYVHGLRHRVAEVNADPDRLGFDVAEHERGKTAAQLWQETLRPLLQRFEREGEAAWPEVVAQCSGYSVRQFLEANHWSEGAMEMFGLLLNQEALIHSSFLELLREEVVGCYHDLVQIEGGMDLLPRAFLPDLHERIRFGAEMVAIDQDDTSVTVYYRTRAGQERVIGDYAIVTVPFPVLRHVEQLKPFSPGKRRAIRQLHYATAAKIFLQARRRFWEEDEQIFGGVTVTDLPVRNVYYPEHGRETGRGVLLASYTWADDARRWGMLSPEERIARAVDNLAHIHPQIREEFEVGTSVVWDQDRFAGGAFAFFNPGQELALFEHIVAPEGRVHFAGEHTTLTHAWIQGAIESGLRAASEVHRASEASAR
ncbi:MAG: flavin monoamine oxidase family protein [Anaerolineae bacterium]|nr:flavin monoamine oxidase family protein [Anaerolineae bacterium]